MKTRINKNGMLFFLIGLPLLNPGYLSQLDYIGDVMNICRLCSFMTVIFLFIWKKKRMSIVATVIIMSQIFIIINTVVRNAAVYKSLAEGFSIISVAFFYDYAIKEDVDAFVKSQLVCFEIAVYINLLTILLFPSGLYHFESDMSLFSHDNNWFFGYYNNATQYYLPAIMFAFINIYLGGKKSRSYMLLAAIAISSVLTWSGGVLVTVFLSVFFVFMGRKYTRLFNYRNFWLIQPTALALILGVQIQNIFRWFLDSFLGKWHSLMLRISLWQKVCGYIADSPIIGYGVEETIVRELKAGFYWATHAHNMILEILYQGGIVYLGLFIMLIFLCGQKMMKNRNNFVVVVIAAVFGGWAVHSIVEPNIASFLMGLFIVGYYSDRIIKAGASNNMYEFVTAKLRELEKWA